MTCLEKKAVKGVCVGGGWNLGSSPGPVFLQLCGSGQLL